jgi:release factor glutamine methyltransferase
MAMVPRERRVLTIREILHPTSHASRRESLDCSRLEAEIMLGHVLGLKRFELYLHGDRPLREEHLAAYRDLVRRRRAGWPLQYLIGQSEFFSLEFQVSPAALIPRPETEILVETVLEHLRGQERPLAVADLGTGCGNIAVALAVNLPQALLWATDISPQALQLAQANARHHAVAGRIRFAAGDLFEPLRGREGFFSAVVSNPPYVRTDQLSGLPVEIRHHEPLISLDGGDDGLAVIRRLAAQAGPFLVPGGLLALEVGAEQAPAAVEMLTLAGPFGRIQTMKDYNGIERVVLAQSACPLSRPQTISQKMESGRR